MKILQAAAKQVQSFPWRSQSIPCAFLMGGGDAVAQLIVEKRRVTDIDWVRTGRFAVLGFFAVGPVLYKWYEFLENTFGRHGFKTVAKKVLLDQVIFAPAITILVLSGLQLVEGTGVEGVKQTMKNDLKDILITTYKVYPVLQTFNFWLVPLRGQVMVDQAATVVWNAYVSWKTQTSKLKPVETESPKEEKTCVEDSNDL